MDSSKITSEQFKHLLQYECYKFQQITESNNPFCKCPVGQGIMYNPLTHQCGASLCQHCITQLYSENSKCPNCEQDLKDVTSTVNIMMRNLINDQNVKCYFNECTWQGKLGSIQDHIDQDCLYVFIVCEFCEKSFQKQKFDLESCPKIEINCDKCKFKFNRDYMSTHLKSECRENDIQCEYCEISVKRKYHQEHLQECPEIEIKCTNCSLNMTQKYLTQHCEECPEAIIQCDNQCNSKIRRKNQDSHNSICPQIERPCLKCGQNMKAFQLEDHVNVCPDEEIKCEFCKNQYKRKLLCQGEHYQNCEKIEILCQLCDQAIQRQKMQLHQEQDCQNKEVSCEYCQLNILKKEFVTHLCPLKQIQCEFCDSKFQYKDLQTHIAQYKDMHQYNQMNQLINNQTIILKRIDTLEEKMIQQNQYGMCYKCNTSRKKQKLFDCKSCKHSFCCQFKICQKCSVQQPCDCYFEKCQKCFKNVCCQLINCPTCKRNVCCNVFKCDKCDKLSCCVLQCQKCFKNLCCEDLIQCEKCDKFVCCNKNIGLNYMCCVSKIQFELVDQSFLLDLESINLIKSWITENQIITLKKIYSGKQNGFKSENFHKYCDFQGPTLTVIQTMTGQIFGGFTNRNWDQSNLFYQDQQAFIFSIDFKTKMNIVQHDRAIGCHPRIGPIFGSDIQISDNSNMNAYSFCRYPATYLNEQTKLTRFQIAGGEYFKVKNIEVFQVEYQ